MTCPLKTVAVLSICALAIGCGRAPADPDDGAWPPSQSPSPPRPGETSKGAPGKTGNTVGSMVSVTVIEKLSGQKTSTSLLVDSGRAHATYWRCTVPCFHCQVPLPDPLPPCSGHRYVEWIPDSGLGVKELIDTQGGMGTSLWLTPGRLARASSSWMSRVEMAGRSAGSFWKTEKIPGANNSWFSRTWASRSGAPKLTCTAHRSAI